MEIILIRHGETDMNRSGAYCGWTDTDLNERGIADARLLRGALSSERIDSIHSSDVKRSRRTAEIIGQRHAAPLHIHEGLREIAFGSWETKTFEEVADAWPEESGRWGGNWTEFTIPGGEDGALFVGRVIAAFEEIRALGGTQVIVTHGGPIRCILSHSISGGMELFWRFRIVPGSLSRLTISNDFAVINALNLKGTVLRTRKERSHETA